MQIIRELNDLAPAIATLRANGRSIALVPTMGALHAGHIALIERAKLEADLAVASIFVNPLQFGANEDFGRYPRQEQDDSVMLEAAGCDLLWLPTAEQLYPAGFATTVSVAGVSERWDGEARPGHFDGVATIVAKLFTNVRPDVAIFGEKDFQQLAVIRRMAADLDLGVGIVGAPTVRDSEGLALSSRNAYLTPDQRSAALALPRALQRARDAIERGGAVSEALAAGRDALTEAGFGRIDYFALVESHTLEPISEAQGEMRLIAAATIGGTRLIDNLAVQLQQLGA